MSLFELGDIELVSGETLPDARLAYHTFGELNAAKDNAIVFPTILAAPEQVLDGWIGEGRALDPTKYFIILPGHFGLAPSSAPSTATGSAAGPGFPSVSIADDVRAQYRLVTEEFGISELKLVLGWSVGGLQVYSWAIQYPEVATRIAPIATAPVPPPWTQLWLKTVVEEPLAGTDTGAGTGLAGVAHASALTAPPRSFYYGSVEGWRNLGFGSADEFVSGFWGGFWLPQNPQDSFVQARKARTSYPGAADESLQTILGRITARTTGAAMTGDNLFPPDEVKQFVEWIPDSKFSVIDSFYGHLATFALSEQDVAAIDGVIRAALDD